MSFLLQDPPLLYGNTHARPPPGSSNHASNEKYHLDRQFTKAQHGGSVLKKQSSLARLMRLSGDAIEAVESLLGAWTSDGFKLEDHAERQRIENKRRVAAARLRNAATYSDWLAAATELDLLEGNNAWKTNDASPDYDAALVKARLKELDDARISCDVNRMVFLVRTSLSRGLGDMGNVKLYQHSHTGTKTLIERYITSALDTLKAVLDISDRQGSLAPDPKHLLEQMLQARQAFGRSALLLSGGATYGMSHIGVLKTLFEAKLLPRIISGASAGSIVCAVMCTRTDEEMPALLNTFCYGDLAVFEKEGEDEGVLTRLARFLKYGAWIDISHLTRVMRDLMGDLTFQEAYNRTRRILNICVSSASLYDQPRLLNYVTAPNVIIWSAVAASCSVPLLFSAADLLAKDPKTGAAVPWNPSAQRYMDGSVDNDLPMARLAELFNVNHFIVSQVNPHVVPFLSKEEQDMAMGDHEKDTTAPRGPGWGETLTRLATGEVLHRMHFLSELGIFPHTLTKARSVLSQKYSGDITILPEISFAHLPRMLKNPTTEFMLQSCLAGERASWPKMSRIRNHCAVELALDDVVQQLRARVVFSQESDLRLKPGSLIAATKRLSTVTLDGGRANRARRHRRRSSQYSDPPTPARPHTSRSFTTPYKSGPTTPSKGTFSGPVPRIIFPSDKTPSPQDHVSSPPFALNDILSSGGDTSNTAISSSEDEDYDLDDGASSATELPSPIPSSAGPFTSSALPRNLFPSSSQPATPSPPLFNGLANPFEDSMRRPTSRGRGSTTSSPASTRTLPTRPLSPGAASPGPRELPPHASLPSSLKKPAATAPSSPEHHRVHHVVPTTSTHTSPIATGREGPEAKYKRLFHKGWGKLNTSVDGAKNEPPPVAARVVPAQGGGGGSRRHRVADPVDISGTRGMLRRKRASVVPGSGAGGDGKKKGDGKDGKEGKEAKGLRISQLGFMKGVTEHDMY